MKQRLQRILSVLCILALITGCMALTAFAEEEYVTKVITVQWDDEDNYEGLRPESVTMQIAGQSVVLNDGNNWTGEAEAAADAQWTVAAQTGYTVSEFGSVAKTVIYRHPVKTTTKTASIVWVDDENAAGLRPESVRINLLADNVICRAPRTAAKDTASISWENLPLHKKGSAEEEITYTVGAADPVEGYVILTEKIKQRYRDRSAM